MSMLLSTPSSSYGVPKRRLCRDIWILPAELVDRLKTMSEEEQATALVTEVTAALRTERPPCSGCKYQSLQYTDGHPGQFFAECTSGAGMDLCPDIVYARQKEQEREQRDLEIAKMKAENERAAIAERLREEEARLERLEQMRREGDKPSTDDVEVW